MLQPWRDQALCSRANGGGGRSQQTARQAMACPSTFPDPVNISKENRQGRSWRPQPFPSNKWGGICEMWKRSHKKQKQHNCLSRRALQRVKAPPPRSKFYLEYVFQKYYFFFLNNLSLQWVKKWKAGYVLAPMSARCTCLHNSWESTPGKSILKSMSSATRGIFSLKGKYHLPNTSTTRELGTGSGRSWNG